MKQVIVFDMDDTLFPEYEFVRSGFHAVDSYLSFEYKIVGFFTKAWQKFNVGSRGDIFDQVLNEIGYSGNTKGLVNELVKVYRSHSPGIRLFDDAKWALEYYSKLVPLALLSDGFLQTQKNKARALGIESYFQKMYFTDQWGRECWKPSHCAFLRVQEDFSVNGNSCVYISDNPSKDFIAPNQLGWRSIFIKRELGEYKNANTPNNGNPNTIIGSLYELEDILAL